MGTYPSTASLPIPSTPYHRPPLIQLGDGENKGRSDGDIWVYIPPKSVQVNILLGKNTKRQNGY